MTADQIKKREQENPDDVDEVPVETADLDWNVVLRRNHAANRPPQHERHDPEADDHVQRMQSRHQEVQGEKKLRVAEVLRFEVVVQAGDVVLDELRVVLERLD